jgi:hypothetical protein
MRRRFRVEFFSKAEFLAQKGKDAMNESQKEKSIIS